MDPRGIPFLLLLENVRNSGYFPRGAGRALLSKMIKVNVMTIIHNSWGLRLILFKVQPGTPQHGFPESLNIPQKEKHIIFSPNFHAFFRFDIVNLPGVSSFKTAKVQGL